MTWEIVRVVSDRLADRMGGLPQPFSSDENVENCTCNRLGVVVCPVHGPIKTLNLNTQPTPSNLRPLYDPNDLGLTEPPSGPVGPLGPKPGDPPVPASPQVPGNPVRIAAYLLLGRKYSNICLNDVAVTFVIKPGGLAVKGVYRLTFRGMESRLFSFENLSDREIAEELVYRLPRKGED